MKTKVRDDQDLQAQESELLRQSLLEATETIEYMVNSLMWSAEYRVLAQSKEKLQRLKKVLADMEK